MNEATDWKLPRPAVVRHVEQDDRSEPLTTAEAAALDRWLDGDGVWLDWLTRDELARLRFLRWKIATCRVTEE